MVGADLLFDSAVAMREPGVGARRRAALPFLGECLRGVCLCGLLCCVILPGCQDAASPSQRIARALASVNLDSGLLLRDNYSSQFPSPYIFITRLAQLGLPYHPSIIEKYPVAPVSDDASECAIHLGILSARYAYAVYYDDKLQAEAHLGGLLLCVGRLGLGKVLEDQHLKRTQGTWQSGDDVLPVIMELLVRVNQALHREGRGHSYALIVAATWAESTRLLLELAEFNEEQGLYRLISEQRYTLPVVLEYLAGFVYDDPITLELYTRLEAISAPMLGIPVTYEYEGTSIDTADRLCRISSRMHVSLTKGNLRALHRQADTLIAWASSCEMRTDELSD